MAEFQVMQPKRELRRRIGAVILRPDPATDHAGWALGHCLVCLDGDVVGGWVDFIPYERLVALWRGRSKREIIQSMVARSPHAAATEKLVAALEVYPLSYLLLASDYPTRIWILDRGEKTSSAEILTAEMRGRKWHSTAIGIDDCEGLVDVASTYLAMVTSWRTLLVMRHEFAHVVTTFFSSEERATLARLFQRAHTENHFAEPLARESLGEYVACALTYSFFPDLDERLARFDASLHRFVTRLRARAEDLSATILTEDWTQSCPPVLGDGGSSAIS